MPTRAYPAAQGLGAAATSRVGATAAVRVGDRPAAAGPPPGLVLCWFCGAVADEASPPGWVVAASSADDGVSSGHGACPGCAAAYRAADPSPAAGCDLGYILSVATPPGRPR